MRLGSERNLLWRTLFTVEAQSLYVLVFLIALAMHRPELPTSRAACDI